jgi:Uri superfamily endonuclease
MPHVAADLPGAPGAYILIIRLDASLLLDVPAFRGKRLEPGLFAYCGSALGSGGIRARVSHHLRTEKLLRWHVDHVTAAGRVEHVGVAVGANECDLADELLSRGGTTPLPGFGSSDCKRCRAHLIAVPDSLILDVPGLTVFTTS